MSYIKKLFVLKMRKTMQNNFSRAGEIKVGGKKFEITFSIDGEKSEFHERT